MARTEEIARGESGRGKRSGSPSPAKLGRLQGLFAEKRGGQADWANCNAEALQAVIAAATKRGAAVSFGLSRDQGAHSLMLIMDGEKETLWFPQDADLNAELENVFYLLETLG